MADFTRKYTNGEITVVWRRELCTHSTICFTDLPEVFNPRRRPWVDVAAADTARIAATVERCPSGALTCHRNADGKGAAALCRCGGSARMPYCDGTHARIGFGRG